MEYWIKCKQTQFEGEFEGLDGQEQRKNYKKKQKLQLMRMVEGVPHKWKRNAVFVVEGASCNVF